MNADSLSGATLSMWHQWMSDCLRAMDAPWDKTINKTNQGYDTWLFYYLQYVDILND
jgi:hypothetical protein